MWILAKDVKAIAADASQPKDLRAFAAGLAERYAYPVDYQFVDVAGVMHGQGEANNHKVSFRSVLDGVLRDEPLRNAKPLAANDEGLANRHAGRYRNTLQGAHYTTFCCMNWFNLPGRPTNLSR